MLKEKKRMILEKGEKTAEPRKAPFRTAVSFRALRAVPWNLEETQKGCGGVVEQTARVGECAVYEEGELEEMASVVDEGEGGLGGMACAVVGDAEVGLWLGLEPEVRIAEEVVGVVKVDDEAVLEAEAEANAVELWETELWETECAIERRSQTEMVRCSWYDRQFALCIRA